MIVRAYGLARGSFSQKRVDYHSKVHDALGSDPQMLPFFDGKSDKIPDFYLGRICNSLGPLWDALPPGALMHDHNAYLNDPVAFRPETSAANARTQAKDTHAVTA